MRRDCCDYRVDRAIVLSRRGMASHQLLLLLLLFLCFEGLHLASATIYIHNESFASLPGLFGKAMIDGRTYQARLQFLHDNPFLCESMDQTSFVRPVGPTINNMTTAEPVVLLAVRGQCPFQRKATVAEQISSMVEFLIVYNYNTDSEDTLVPMYSEFGDTRLVLLSVTHRAGQALKDFIAEQDDSVLQQGGPMLRFDSTPPEGLLSVDDLRNMLLSALGLFFMLISFSGCIMIIAGTHGHVHMEGNRLVVVTGTSPPRHSSRHGLLTVEQVRRLKPPQPDDQNGSASNPRPQHAHDEDDQDNSCAVCIDGFDENSQLTVLPCHHVFHTDCIAPWLTERQSQCPLCKFDVLEYVHEQEARDIAAAPLSTNASVWDRVFRYRWMHVQQHDEDINNRVAITPQEMMDAAHELEMTERPTIS